MPMPPGLAATATDRGSLPFPATHRATVPQRTARHVHQGAHGQRGAGGEVASAEDDVKWQEAGQRLHVGR